MAKESAKNGNLYVLQLKTYWKGERAYINLNAHFNFLNR